MPFKIIFLDIDGVLNSGRSALAHIGPVISTAELPLASAQALAAIDPVAVGLINRLCRKDPSVRIVVSSSHRRHFATLEELKAYMVRLGLTGEVIAATPKVSGPRGLEIKAWLEDQDLVDVGAYLILDDGNDMLEEQVSFIRCDASIGMSERDYFDACEMLGITESTLIVPESAT